MSLTRLWKFIRASMKLWLFSYMIPMTAKYSAVRWISF